MKKNTEWLFNIHHAARGTQYKKKGSKNLELMQLQNRWPIALGACAGENVLHDMLLPRDEWDGMHM